MKRYRGVIIFGIAEVLSYFWFNVKNLEIFFIMWTFISIFIGGYILIGDSKVFIRAGNVGKNNNNLQHTQTYFAQKMGESVSVKNSRRYKEKMKAIIPLIILAIYFVINVIGVVFVSFYLK